MKSQDALAKRGGDEAGELDVLSELIYCRRDHKISAYVIGYLILLATTMAAGLRALLPAAPEPTRPSAPVWAVAFTPVERDVLIEVATASGGVVALIDAENPLSLWSSKKYAIARFRAGLRIFAMSFTCKGLRLASQGARAREAAVALAERELHGGAPAPDAIIVANQFSPRQKAMLAALALRKVRSVYVQHAATGGYEGPLIVDCAVLQGSDSIRKYLSQGPAPAELVLGGAIKVEAARALRENGAVASVVGLCPDIGLDPEVCGAQWFAEARALAAETGSLRVQVRPHPTDPSFEAWRAAAAAAGVAFSNSRVVPTQIFLAGLKGLIVGDSNLVVEGLALGAQVRRMSDTTSALADQYGMIAKGILDPTRQRKALSRFVHTRAPFADPLASVVVRLALAPVKNSVFAKRRNFRLANGTDLWLV